MGTNLLTAGVLISLALAGGCKKAEEKADALDVRPLVRVGKMNPSCALTDGVRLQGSVRTKFSASVAARVSGTLDTVLVDESQMVKSGQPLFQVDKVNLESHVRIAQDDLDVAKASFKESEAMLAEAQAAYDKASIDASRMKKLYEEDKAVTKDMWEKADLQFKSAVAAKQRVQAAVETARVRIVQAETALSVSRKNLGDSQGVAPFDGVITKKNKDRGEFVSAGMPVFEMDDPGVYEVCFSMNADAYDRVETGKTVVRFNSGREAAVTYKAPSVHPVTRTFEVRVTVEHAQDLAPGMIRDALVVFRQFTAATVPSQAVGLRGGKHLVFIVRGEKVVGVPVTVGLEWQGNTEIKNPDVLKDADMVIDGMLLLNEGDSVRIQKEGVLGAGN